MHCRWPSVQNPAGAGAAPPARRTKASLAVFPACLTVAVAATVLRLARRLRDLARDAQGRGRAVGRAAIARVGDRRLGHGLRGDRDRAVGLAGQGHRERALGAIERHGRAAEQARAGDRARDRRRRPGGDKRRGGPRRRRQSASVLRRRTRGPRGGLGAGRRGRRRDRCDRGQDEQAALHGHWTIPFMRRAPPRDRAPKAGAARRRGRGGCRSCAAARRTRSSCLTYSAS